MPFTCVEIVHFIVRFLLFLRR